ncbi:MAG: hypothetical protein HYZ29_13625 [Myxococcales bacterium]|nr:hypothetical protein [Myxococcales bacterium]
MLGQRLALLSTGEFPERAIALWARSLAIGAELSVEEWATAGELEAVFESMYLMAVADGEIARDEVLLLTQSLEAIISASERHGGSRFELTLPLLKLGEVLERFSSAVATSGVASRIDDVARRLVSAESRCLALRLAAGVAFVDDFVATAEMQALDALARALGFDHEDALRELKEAHAALMRA